MADAVDKLTDLARSLDDVEETVACEGTAIEQARFRTGGKAFLFVQRKGEEVILRLKLSGSLDQAEAAGDHVVVGKGGWTTCRLPVSRAPSAQVKRWVRESHALSVKPAKKKAATKKKKAATKKKKAATKRR